MSAGRTSVQKNVQLFNRRIPVAIERDQKGLPKTLRKERYREEPFKALETIFDYLDRIFSYSEGLVACKKGCSFCCHMQVILTQVEADYIANKTGVPAKKLLQPPRTVADGWVDATKPCPFLKSHQCTIYPFRPVNCRTYVNFEETNEKCQFGSTSKIFMLDRDGSFPGAMQAYGELAARHGGYNGDIRDFFDSSSALTLK